jgi:flagellar assembly protein FliH
MRRFDFDTIFDEDGAILQEGSARRAAFTEADLENARKQGFEAGRKSETARAEAASAAALAEIARAAQLSLAQWTSERAGMQAEAAALALAAAKKMAGLALERLGEDRVAALFEDVLEHMRHPPRLVLRVAPAHADSLRPRLEAIAQDHAFDGALMVRPDPKVRVGDLIADWGDGAVIHDQTLLLQRIEDLFAQTFTGGQS